MFPEGLSPGQPWTVLSYKPAIRQQILRAEGTIHSESAEEILKWVRLPGAPRGGSREPAYHPPEGPPAQASHWTEGDTEVQRGAGPYLCGV